MDDRVPILDRSDYSVLWVSKTWVDKHGHGKIIVADPGSKIKPCDDPQATFVSLKKPVS